MLGLQQLTTVSRGPRASATAVPAGALSLYLPLHPTSHVRVFAILLYRIWKRGPGTKARHFGGNSMCSDHF